jgi:hypothetical protein
VFGCIELGFGIESEWNTKSKMERKSPPTDGTNSDSCLDVQTVKLNVLLNLDNNNLPTSMKNNILFFTE